MRAEVDVRPVRERRAARARRAPLRAVAWRRVAVLGGGAAFALTLATGVVFAGSADRIAAGVTVAGVKVGGMTSAEAVAALEGRARRYARVPVVFTAGRERFSLRPRDLDARVDWSAVVRNAHAAGNWPLPFRGVKRVAVRLFGAELEPTADLYAPRLEHELGRMAKRLERPGRNAAIVLHDLEPTLVPEREGRILDRGEARRRIARALAAFHRRPVALPVRVGPPAVTEKDLEPVLDQVRMALSAPVRFGWRDAHWLVQPAQLADLLSLPARGRSDLRIAGREADRYFGQLSRAVDRRPQNADFAVRGDGRVRILPSRRGRALDAESTARALLAGALSPESREAEMVVRTVEPRLTTQRARAMNVTRVLASYTTAYAGSEDRIRNLRLAVSLVDGTQLAPGETFSFNETVGPRTAKRGFRVAPTIVDGKYKDEFGGGVSQVATTIFNAAWEAGVKIAARTAHSLYIGRYPLGRDATVNYPDVDLKFVNDTGEWLVVEGRSHDGGITISLLGSPTNRRVVSEPGELRVTGPPGVETLPDPTRNVGQTTVVDDGEPSRTIAVKRVVYEGGKLLYDETWYTSYSSEPKIVRVGTIPVPGEKPGPAPSPGTQDKPKEKPKDEPRSPPSPPPAQTGTTATTPTATTPRR